MAQSSQENPPSLSLGLKSLLALALVIGGLWLMDTHLARDFERNGLLGLGFLLLAGLSLGHLCALIGLPRLTGYLVAGFLSGPSFLTVISESQVEQLRLVNGLALALIALHAGCEFTKEMLKKNFASLAYCSLTHILAIGFGITALMVILSPYLPFIKDLPLPALLAVSALYSVIAISKSPAVVVAVLGETKAKGPLSDHALGIVVVLDVLVLVAFSIILALTRSTIDPAASLSLLGIYDLGEEIIASIAAGTFFGLLIIAYLWLVNKERLLFVVAISYGVTALCAYLHYDTLLVFVVAGFIVTNFSRQKEKMIGTIESLSSVTMIVFFATAGASLHLDELKDLWSIVLIIVIARAFFTWAGDISGHYLAKSSSVLKKYGFTPFVSQAGLSIGLAMVIYDALPGIGPPLATLAISVVTVNEIIGPILFKIGLIRAKEV